jgi:hypothetical protein
MKDFISKATFGFLMAQFVPGAIAVYSIAYLYLALEGRLPNSCATIASAALELWGGSFTKQLVLIGLCTGAGMVIHGLHWSVLGFLETHYGEWKDDSTYKLKPVYETYWHNMRFVLQVFVGPVKIFCEIVQLFFLGRDIGSVAIEENVQNIDKEKMEAFQFAQDFYLHFAQFYAHTSYALLISFIALSTHTIVTGLSIKRIVLAALLYVFSGLFFLIGRIQLASLFKAEVQMTKGKVAEVPREKLLTTKPAAGQGKVFPSHLPSEDQRSADKKAD